MDKLVSFNVAKLAKQKGVNLPCSHFYVLQFSSFKENRMPQKFNKDLSENQLQFVTISKTQPHLAGAMTQSKLAQWLRLEHGIHIFPSIYSNGMDYEFKVYRKGKHLISEGLGFSFDEAFDAGLLIALNEIKL